MNPHLSEQISIVKSLQSSSDIDIRAVGSFGELVAKLRSPALASAQVVNLYVDRLSPSLWFQLESHFT